MHTIFYFTGTGNCLKVARELATGFNEDIQLIRVCKDNLYLAKENYSGMVGIVYPTYSNNMPIMLKNFLEELSVETNTYIYTVLTWGGLAGGTHVFMNSIFLRKGAHISAEFQIRMPHNGIVIFDATKADKQKLWLEDVSGQVKKIVEKVNSREIIKLKLTLPMKILMRNKEQEAPNRIFDPLAREKKYWVNGNCNGCGICTRVCPADDIELINGRPQWKSHCESCMACFQWCPKQAIQFSNVTEKRRHYHHPEITLQDVLLK